MDRKIEDKKDSITFNTSIREEESRDVYQTAFPDRLETLEKKQSPQHPTKKKEKELER